jgi:hypothetical protein
MEKKYTALHINLELDEASNIDEVMEALDYVVEQYKESFTMVYAPECNVSYSNMVLTEVKTDEKSKKFDEDEAIASIFGTTAEAVNKAIAKK